MIEEHVYFHFQKNSSRIIHVFDVLFNFPGGWNSRNISFWLPEIGQLWRLKKYLVGYFFLFNDWLSLQKNVWIFIFNNVQVQLFVFFDISFNFPGRWKTRNCLNASTLACPRAVTCHHHLLTAAPSVHAGCDYRRHRKNLPGFSIWNNAFFHYVNHNIKQGNCAVVVENIVLFDIM